MRRTRPVIAIDGPVGAGKSTVARALARKLGFAYVNTGAMYRAVAIAARAAGVDPDGPALAAELERLLGRIRIAFDGERITLDGRDVSDEIGDPAIGDLASRLSTIGVVRERMRELQRAAGRDGGVVMEGRDVGTAIFPDAEAKFFLTADVNVRAARRHAELAAKGAPMAFEEVRAQLLERDRRDRERTLAPLKPAPDAIEIDSTASGVDAVVERMRRQIEELTRAV
jgi:cytidylate kinase